MSQAQSQVQRPKSEFLGLHDPWAAPPATKDEPRRPAEPVFTREKAGELVRAGATLAVILAVMSLAVLIVN